MPNVRIRKGEVVYAARDFPTQFIIISSHNLLLFLFPLCLSVLAMIVVVVTSCRSTKGLRSRSSGSQFRVTFQNGTHFVLEWCLNSLVTFKTVKRFGNKKYKVWCSMVKIPSRSKSEYCSRCFICQLLNILVFCRTSVGVSQWPRSSCARASLRHSQAGW